MIILFIVWERYSCISSCVDVGEQICGFKINIIKLNVIFISLPSKQFSYLLWLLIKRMSCFPPNITHEDRFRLQFYTCNPASLIVLNGRCLRADKCPASAPCSPDAERTGCCSSYQSQNISFRWRRLHLLYYWWWKSHCFLRENETYIGPLVPLADASIIKRPDDFLFRQDFLFITVAATKRADEFKQRTRNILQDFSSKRGVLPDHLNLTDT